MYYRETFPTKKLNAQSKVDHLKIMIFCSKSSNNYTIVICLMKKLLIGT